jgi:uncharacterized protein (TIGR03083 family)
MAVTTADAVAALERATRRFTMLLRSASDPGRRVDGLSWTVRDLGAHLASGSVAYAQIARGGGSPYEDLDTRGETNQQRIDAEAASDLSLLADDIDANVARMSDKVRARADNDVVAWHGGLMMRVPAFLGAAVGEFLFHGRDLAVTLGQPWPIERRDALPVVDFFTAVMPHVVNESAARGATATYEVRFRGYDTSTLTFDRGTLSVREGRADRADVRMSVDPVAFLLLGYKRSGLARQVVTGRAVAWGRRPWLALRFTDLFQPP